MKDNFCQGASPPRTTPFGTGDGAAVLRARLPGSVLRTRAARGPSDGWRAATATLVSSNPTTDQPRRRA